MLILLMENLYWKKLNNLTRLIVTYQQRIQIQGYITFFPLSIPPPLSPGVISSYDTEQNKQMNTGMQLSSYILRLFSSFSSLSLFSPFFIFEVYHSWYKFQNAPKLLTLFSHRRWNDSFSRDIKLGVWQSGRVTDNFLS